MYLFRVENIFLRITVAKSAILAYVSTFVGWIYFIAWSVSFYPQILTNYRRRAVTGLNFDFLALNVVGFALYATFNLSLFFSADVQAEYLNRYPRGTIPVLPNDVVFSVHAFFATLLTIGQCYMYDRGVQQVSKIAISFLACIALVIVILVGLSAGSIVSWLDFLSCCSYIKLFITLVKYIPQVIYFLYYE